MRTGGADVRPVRTKKKYKKENITLGSSVHYRDYSYLHCSYPHHSSPHLSYFAAVSFSTDAVSARSSRECTHGVARHVVGVARPGISPDPPSS